MGKDGLSLLRKWLVGFRRRIFAISHPTLNLQQPRGFRGSFGAGRDLGGRKREVCVALWGQVEYRPDCWIDSRGVEGPPTHTPRRQSSPIDMTFLGTYDHTLDAKNRLTVPVKFRGPLGDGVIVSRGIETCVSVWTPAGFDGWTKSMLEALGAMTPQARQFRRVVSASAFETELDAAGRIMLPSKLIDHAGIEREISVIGNDDAFEIWDRKAWESYDSEISPTILDLTDAIGADA